MRVLVACKRVIDYAVKVRVNAAKNGVEMKNVKMSMNPFDEIGVEQAVRMKESKQATEVIAVSIGPAKAQETIRTALAMGADKGLHVSTDMSTDLELQPLAVAKIMKAVVDKVQPDLVIMGKQAIDDDSSSTPQMLSRLLGWPQGISVSKVDIDGKSMEVTREVDGGLQVLSMTLPAVISTDLRLNEPRYASLPNIMKARKKPVETLKVEDLGVDTAPRLQVLKVEDPPVREAGIKVADAAELVDKLKNEAKCL
jgi:electron transfer flavoprotein beta subunit